MILANITRAIREQNYYAVVLEFVIVIAGVVIGFQINAWNEGRAEKAQGRAYLALLENEIANHKQTFDANVGAASARIGNLRALETAIKRPESVREAPVELALNLYYSRWQSYASPGRSVYDGLESSGDIALIENGTLVELIRTHYRDIAFWDSVLGEEAFILQQYTKATAGYLTMDQTLAVYADAPEQSSAFEDFSGEDGVAFAQRLALDEDINRWLPEVFDHHRGVRGNTLRLGNQTEALLERIRAETAP